MRRILKVPPIAFVLTMVGLALIVMIGWILLFSHFVGDPGHDGEIGVYVSPQTQGITAVAYSCDAPLTWMVLLVRDSSSNQGARNVASWNLSADTTQAPIEVPMSATPSEGAELQHGDFPLESGKTYFVSSGNGNATTTGEVRFSLQQVEALAAGQVLALSPSDPSRRTTADLNEFLWHDCPR